jgi:ParB family chromosome partitioning protein
MTTKKPSLGQNFSSLGIGELLSNIEEEKHNNLKHLAIEMLQPGQYQPRKKIAEAALQDLAESIKAQGIIQPLVVRQVGKNYEIVAGERRWRAAQLAGLHNVPVIIQNLSDENTLAISLIENIQREDLNAIEEAQAIQKLANKFNLTHEKVASLIGKSRTTVTNLLRLLELHPEVKKFLEDEQIEMGHGRALLALSPELQLLAAKVIIAKSLSVRATEELVKDFTKPEKSTKKAKTDPDILNFTKMLADTLNAKVKIQHSQKGSGKLVIQYNSVDELEGIIEKFK